MALPAGRILHTIKEEHVEQPPDDDPIRKSHGPVKTPVLVPRRMSGSSNNFPSIIKWRNQQNLSNMSMIYQDNDHWIEDRYTRGRTHERKNYGYWTGDVRAATYCYPLGASLLSPPPPFTGFAHDEPGEVPGPKTLPHGTQTGSRPGPTTNKAAGSSSRTSDSRSNAGSEPRSRPHDHYEPSIYREEVLRHAAMTSRDRYDDSYSGSRYRPAHRNEQHSAERDRLPDFRHGSYESDRLCARDTRNYRNRADPQLPNTNDVRRGDTAPRIVASPDLRRAERGPDGHPQSLWAINLDSPDYDESDDEDARPNTDYVALETEHIERARARSDAPPPALRPSDSRLEEWEYRQIAMIDQARNLGAWLACAQQGSYEKVCQIVNHASARPFAFRSEGDAYILRKHP
ncbi:hypothetical protein B0H11DRAFT_1943845 [Mycena galericulata]|nr:hypothetical protein B0H11DRAFT_1943845 [Mycena galericulata]